MLASPALAAGKYTREGFALHPDQRSSLLVAFASLHDYAYDNKGGQIRSPAWESAAETSIVGYFSHSPLASAFDIRFESTEQTQAAPTYADLLESFNNMTSAVLFRVPYGTFSASHPENNPNMDRLRLLQGNFSYAFPANFFATHFGLQETTDYILLVQLEDGHRSTEQFLGELSLAVVCGVGHPPGDRSCWMRQTPHVGNFLLVNSRTGGVEWYFGDGRMEGDERTPEGAERKLREVVNEIMRLRGR
jgi:hypothetical protein